ncbi:PAP2 (acid phosphatase) superfamily protein [Variovorax sp. PBL-H6]|uniref:phosphatase PAP2 family protein n=1 Tax=Variovorax sp. PBL-H6 TaxID=434009 RepID=UPI00131878BB|nr:phosphatase PAP2 family protein [Variovorax sp. PBL-H6]VTU26746.1 PAP2 (acid phosphatase) superfamily protein [Variovorax sp. PBL-H6]
MLRSTLARQPLAWTLLSLLLLLAWDASGLDLALAGLSGTPTGFPWRDNGFLVHVMHEGARSLSWLLLAALFAAIRWPVGVLRRLRMRDRAQIPLAVLAGVLVVSLVKQASATSCPWDLQAFGGMAHYVSHWAWGVRDGGPGGCFPAGHASAGFAFVAGWFVLRRVSPSAARVWLAGAMVVGLLLGLAQQQRGAHYMSHTLWTAWLCWTTGFAVDALLRLKYFRRDAPAGVLPKLNGS